MENAGLVTVGIFEDAKYIFMTYLPGVTDFCVEGMLLLIKIY